jgi:hypothetical protein
VVQEGATDSSAHPIGINVEVIDPTVSAVCRDGQHSYYPAVLDGNGYTAWNELVSNPKANVIVSMEERCKRHQFMARAEVHVRDRLGVIQVRRT